MDIIEELYFGNIQPYEKPFEKTRESKKAVEICLKYGDKLRDMLSGEAREMFSQLLDAHNALLTAAGMENFKHGFRLGVKLMQSCEKGIGDL